LKKLQNGLLKIGVFSLLACAVLGFTPVKSELPSEPIKIMPLKDVGIGF